MNTRYEDYETIGSKVLCGNDIPDRIPIPRWLDKDKMRRAQSLARNHFFGILFAHLSGLILLVHIKSILIPLLSTGNSRSVCHLFGRYFRTLVHVKNWYEGDIWDHNHSSHQSILQVRKMHTKVSKDLNKGKQEMNDEMSLSQCDMAITQFAFIGFIVLYPRQMGFSKSPEDMEALLHFWKGVGYLLGMDDKYNLCNGSLDEIKAMCELILQNKLKKSIIESPERDAIEMSRGIVNAVKTFVRLLTYDGIIKYLFEVIDIPRDIQLNMLSAICYHSLRITFNYFYRFFIFAFMANNLLRLSIYLTNTNWRKKSIEKSLTKKYNIVLYEKFETIETNTEFISV